VRGIPRLDMIVEQKSQDLDSLTDRLARGPEKLIFAKQQELAVLSARLSPDRFRREPKRDADELVRLAGRLHPAWQRAYRDMLTRTINAGDRLESVAPQRVLERGYAMVWDAKGAPVTSVAAVASGEALTVQFGDGKVGVVASGAPAAAAPKPSRARRAPDEAQGKLL
jgi:exodeoxyribonuclease VII large subunit